MTIDLDAIEAAALAATPGPWSLAVWHGDEWPEKRVTAGPQCRAHREAVAMAPRHATRPVEDMHHIATMDPQTTLALVERVRELEALLGETVEIRWSCFCGHAHKWIWREEDCQGSTKMYCEACGAATTLIVHPDGKTEAPA